MLQNQYQHRGYDNNDGGRDRILTPFQRKLLQKSLQADLSELYRQRLEIMLLADEGKTQTQICKALGCSSGTARHWMLIARIGQAHHWKDRPIGRPQAVNDQYLERLKELVSQSPREFGYAFRRWTGQWLSKHLAKEFGIKICDRRINQLLKDMGLSTREQPARAEDNTNQGVTGSGIVIGNLQAAKTPESNQLWPFNSLKLG